MAISDPIRSNPNLSRASASIFTLHISLTLTSEAIAHFSTSPPCCRRLCRRRAAAACVFAVSSSAPVLLCRVPASSSVSSFGERRVACACRRLLPSPFCRRLSSPRRASVTPLTLVFNREISLNAIAFLCNQTSRGRLWFIIKK
ncbi:hypothetical protein PIB30_044005 [Stylosanthes scabra]|uniref:Uncharacterized protein n=1 Tax=Stylosanthes scabra TaxID=79078 RepID=A0ABU6WE80_9FABA|nr:hypothetical protein [Stylosanthes scabra]